MHREQTSSQNHLIWNPKNVLKGGHFCKCKARLLDGSNWGCARATCVFHASPSAYGEKPSTIIYLGKPDII